MRAASLGQMVAPVVVTTDTPGTAIENERSALATHSWLEEALLDLVADTAKDSGLPDCDAWRERYQLGVAANLLGIVGPRLERSAGGGAPSDHALGWVAFAEGLRSLAHPAIP